ncbi:MAG: carbohydrate ABC transporter permease [Sphaerochaetaceae bacterium]
MEIRSKGVRTTATIILGVVAVVFFLYPLVWLLLNSFKDTTEIMTGNSFSFPTKWKLANYTDALFARNILRYFGNSVFITTCTILLTVTLSLMLGYALTRMRWRQAPQVSSMLALGMMLPSQIVIVPIFILLRQLHLVNNPLSLILTVTAFNIPLSAIISASFLKSIPYEMEEAGLIDGANLYTILTRIILPQVKPALSAMSINIFINSWNEFIYALVLIVGKQWRTLPIALMNYSSGKYGTDYGGMFAAMVITSLLPIALFVFFSDEVEKSLSAGALLK